MSDSGNRLVIRGGGVLLPDGRTTILDVVVEGSLVVGLAENVSGALEIDAQGCLVLPGLIDLHTHGIGFESAKEGSLVEIARIEASFGATTFYPTLFGPPDETAAQIRRHLGETDRLRMLPQVEGFRLESPYLAVPSGGTNRDISPIEPSTTEMLLKAAQGHIKIWDVSPELLGAPDLVRQLSSRGIVCSIAHTHCSIAQARDLVDAGARLVTHFFDVFSPPEYLDPDTDIAPVGLTDYLVLEDRVTCEIIGDGTHVHPLLVEKALRCKTPDRVAFVTDSNVGASLAPGRYCLPGGWGEAVIAGPNDGVRIPERGMCLAGSALTPIDNFRNAVKLFGKDLFTATRLCSGTPARLMGLNKGEVAVGRDADLIVLDGDLELLYTIASGAMVYARDGGK